LANDKCSQTYRELAEHFEAGREDQIMATIERLKGNSAAILAYTAHVFDDVTKAACAESNAAAFAWLQVAAARVLEYAWHGHEWTEDTTRGLLMIALLVRKTETKSLIIKEQLMVGAEGRISLGLRTLDSA